MSRVGSKLGGAGGAAPRLVDADPALTVGGLSAVRRTAQLVLVRTEGAQRPSEGES